MFSNRLTNLNAPRAAFLLLGIVSLTSAIPAINTSVPSSTTGVLVPSSATSSSMLASGTLSAPLPPPDTRGWLTVSSLCDFEVWHSLTTDGNNNNATWNPLPKTGVIFTYGFLKSLTDPLENDEVITAYHGFNIDGKGDGSFTQLAVTWYPDENLIAYDLSQHAGNVTSPFLMYGYQAWPEAATGPQYQFCNNLTCAANEHPCTASYMEGMYTLYRS